MSTFPTTNVSTTNVDSGTDNPSSARADIKTAFDLVNDIINSYGVKGGIATYNTDGRLVIDTNMFLQLVSGNARINLDSGDYLWWDAANNRLQMNIAGTDFMVSSNAPSFRAYLGSSQTIPHNTTTQVQFNTESFDTDSCYNTSTFRFTPTVAGYYYFDFRPFFSTFVIDTLAEGYVRKNGSDISTNHDIAKATDRVSLIVADEVYMNGTTDYLEAFIYQNSGSSQTLAASSNRCRFLAYFVRS